MQQQHHQQHQAASAATVPAAAPSTGFQPFVNKPPAQAQAQAQAGASSQLDDLLLAFDSKPANTATAQAPNRPPPP